MSQGHPLWRSTVGLARPGLQDVARAFLGAVRINTERLPLRAIGDAIAQRRTSEALTLAAPVFDRHLLHAATIAFGAIARATGLRSVTEAEQRRRVRKAQSAALNTAPLGQVQELAARIADTQTADLITLLDDEGKAAIRSVIAAIMRGQISQREAEQLIRSMVGLNERQAIALANYQMGLAEEGVDPARMESLVARYGEKLLAQRAEMIARSETMRSANRGITEGWKAAREAGWLEDGAERIWIASPGACDECKDLNGQTTTLDDPFADDAEPGEVHPNCECTEGLKWPDAQEAAA